MPLKNAVIRKAMRDLDAILGMRMVTGRGKGRGGGGKAKSWKGKIGTGKNAENWAKMANFARETALWQARRALSAPSGP